MMRSVGVVVTTCNRPLFLERTLKSLIPLGSRVLVVDDSHDIAMQMANGSICAEARPEAPSDIIHLRLAENRGLAASLAIGVIWWLVDLDIEYVSTFQDDTECLPETHQVLVDLARHLKDPQNYVLTGHDAKEHNWVRYGNIGGIKVVEKKACRATHMFAHRDAWARVIPLRSKGVGYPKKTGEGRGEGSDVDWYICGVLKTRVVPNLVRTFAWEATDSCWNNRQRVGADAPLDREALRGWSRR